jgi:hypothetical protein
MSGAEPERMRVLQLSIRYCSSANGNPARFILQSTISF